MKKAMFLFFKGIPIGIANTLPGISGGTMALLLNIYEELLNAIKTLRFSFLIPLAAGALLALVLTANAISFLLEYYYNYIHSVLFFLILASSITTIKEIRTISWNYILAMIICFFLTLYITQNSIAYPLNPDVQYYRIIISGIISSSTMILPGVSGATVLIMLGTYETILSALVQFKWDIIILFSLSALTGILVFASLMVFLLQKYRAMLMAILTGLILGSSAAVIPKTLNLDVAWGFFTAVAIVLILRWSTTFNNA